MLLGQRLVLLFWAQMCEEITKFQMQCLTVRIITCWKILLCFGLTFNRRLVLTAFAALKACVTGAPIVTTFTPPSTTLFTLIRILTF